MGLDGDVYKNLYTILILTHRNLHLHNNTWHDSRVMQGAARVSAQRQGYIHTADLPQTGFASNAILKNRGV